MPMIREPRAIQVPAAVPTYTMRRAAAVRGDVSGRRVVTTPHEAVQPLTWAERHKRFRARQARRAPEPRLVPRTLAQTGHAAQTGQVRLLKPLPRLRTGTRVPMPSRVPIRSRKVQRSGSFWRRLLGFLFILAVLVGSFGFALFGPVFRVQQVDINGTQNRTLIAAIRSLNMQGHNIFLLNQEELVTRLESLPQVASASLSVQLPSTVTVGVQERVPVLLWQAGRSIFGLAQDGTVIAPRSELSGTEHLALVLDTRQAAARQIHPGSRFDEAEIVFVEQVFTQLPGIEGVTPFSLQFVDSITIGGHAVPANQAGRGSYVIISANGWQAYLGDSQNSNSLGNRLLELQQILTMARQKGWRLATIDLRFGPRPAYTLKT